MIKIKPLRRARPPAPSEHALQRSVVAYLRLALEPPVYWSAVDAGAGKLSAAAAGAAKGRGVKAGLCDIFIFVPRNGLTLVLGVELKSRLGTLSPIQKETHALLRAAGVECHVARSVENVESILAGYDVPLRARSLPFKPGTQPAISPRHQPLKPSAER